MTEESVGVSKQRERTEVRRTVFMSTVVAFVLFLYLFSPFSSLFLGWFVDFEDNISHRVHEVTFGMLFAMMLAGVAVQLRKPEAKIAALQQAILVSVVLSVVVAASTGWEWTALLYVVPPLAIAYLHPNRRAVFAVPRMPHGGLLYLALPAALPFIFGFIDEFEKAAKELRGHQAHWGGMAAFALIIVILALLAASHPPGWRVVAWSTGSSMIVYGVASMSFPFDASARPDLLAVISIVWGTLFLVVTQSIVRREREALEVGPDTIPDDPPGIDQPLVLRRAEEGKLLAGVAIGLARRLDMPVAAVRVLIALPFVIPPVGMAAYAIAWWRIPMEQPGDVVQPARRGRWHRLRSVAVIAPAVLIALAGGVSIYGVAETIIPPPVPHDIESVSASSCVECHATGDEQAPIIDPYTHNFHDEFLDRRSSLPFCGQCHRLPIPTAGSSTPGQRVEYAMSQRVLPDPDSRWHPTAIEFELIERTSETFLATVEAP